jgi:tripartite-type tricarboxylate transporter receptor subunit TctC
MKMSTLGKNMHLKQVAAMLTCLIAAALAQAQAWPNKPIRIINGNAPGGSADVTARVVSDAVSRSLGQPFIIESRAGATGGIAMDAVARAAPDGYTLLITADSSLYQPILKPSLPYTVEKNFSPIAILTSQPMVLAAHASLKVKNAAELVALAKRSTTPLPYATPSASGTQVVAGAAFARVAGITLTNIPYKGGGQAVNDLASGQVPLGVLGSAPLMPHAASGRIIMLAVASKTRSSVLPDVPTMAEAGYPGVDLSQWFGLLGPAGMPTAVIARLSNEFQKALADPEVRRKLAASGLEAAGGGTPEEFTRRMRDEGEVWARIAKEAGLRAD